MRIRPLIFVYCIVPLVIAAACGDDDDDSGGGAISASEFCTEVVATTCGLAEDCDLLAAEGFDSYADCINWGEAELGCTANMVFACDEADRQATECLTALEALSCDDVANDVQPQECDISC